jgi:hypothetical protein
LFSANVWLGSNVPGRIAARREVAYQDNRGARHEVWEVDYTYGSGSDVRTATTRLDKVIASSKLEPGTSVMVRRALVDVGAATFLREPEDEVVGHVTGMLLAALILAVAGATAGRQMLFLPLRARWLYRFGRAFPGEILQKREAGPKARRYEVDYSFEDGAASLGATVVLDKALWDRLAEGQAITVLCHPTRPAPSLIYECGEYDWADPRSRRGS